MSNHHPLKKLGDIAHIEMGQSPASAYVHDRLDRGVPFLQGCAEFGASSPIPKKSCSGPAKIGLAGSSLISVRAPVGALNKADQNYVIGRGLAAVSAKTGTYQPYLNFALEWASKSLNRVAQGSTFEAIGNKELRNLEVSIPTEFTEQQGIADVLSAMDEQIEATNVEIEKLNMQRQGLATSLLACKHLSESEIDDVRLSEVIPEVQYGISSSLAETGVIPVLRMNNLSGGEIDVSDLKFSPTDVHSGLYLKPNDVLFNRTNSMEHVGRTALWRGQLTKCTFASYLVRLSPDPKRLLPEYLVYLLEWDENQLQMRKYATPGVQQVNINPTSLRRCKVQIPKSLDVQRATIAALDTARENIESLKSEVEKLKLKKQGLMHDLLTGAVRVMEAN